MARLLGKACTWRPVHTAEERIRKAAGMGPWEGLTGVSSVCVGGCSRGAHLGLVLSRPALGRPESPQCQPGLPPSQLGLEVLC